MGIKRFKPITPGLRHAAWPDFNELTAHRPEKGLLRPLIATGGRNNQGRVTVRGRGGGHKRRYRLVDFDREKQGVPARVISREYDPNRSSWISLLHYADGEKRYILSPLSLEIGATVQAGEQAEARPGNALPLKHIPVGTMVHAVEFTPGGGGKLARAAGTAVQLMGVENGLALLRLPSREMRYVPEDCMATVGQVSNIDHKNVVHGQAGRVRHLGRRPITRGVAKNPCDHPHGGGEAHHHTGGPPVSPQGKLSHGPRTRRPGRFSDRWIVTRARDVKRQGRG